MNSKKQGILGINIGPNKITKDQKNDFCLGLKNFFNIALDKIKMVRSQDTPIVIAKDVGRKNEKIDCVRLRDIDSNKIDMFTMLIVGSRSTKVYQKDDFTKRMYTPRGYNLN